MNKHVNKVRKATGRAEAISSPTPQPPKPRPKPRMSENATAVIWLKRGTVYLAKHLEISSNSYIQRITHMH